MDYDFEWFVIEHEYCLNPVKEFAPNENDAKYLQYSELLLEALEAGVGYRVEFDDVLYIAPTPVVRINSQNAFHSAQVPAIRWKETKDEFYYLNGVSFPKDLWTKVVSGKMPFKDILAIVDTDQRTQAMRFGNVKEFIVHAKGKKLDEFSKMRLDGTKITYQLYKFPAGEVFTKEAHYMIYDDVVPESDKQYMSGVPEFNTVPDAMSWKFSSDEYTLTPDMWKTLSPGIDMA